MHSKAKVFLFARVHVVSALRPRLVTLEQTFGLAQGRHMLFSRALEPLPRAECRFTSSNPVSSRPRKRLIHVGTARPPGRSRSLRPSRGSAPPHSDDEQTLLAGPGARAASARAHHQGQYRRRRRRVLTLAKSMCLPACLHGLPREYRFRRGPA